MRGSVDGVEHPTLAPPAGRPLAEAGLTDRARLGVLLQGAALLSLLEAARWRLRRGFAGARVTAAGALTGLEAAPGRAARPAQEQLAALAGELFDGAAGVVAGRGEARRIARDLLARWRGRLLPLAADEAVAQLIESAPFLVEAVEAPARAALEGVLVRADRRTTWRAGRRGRGGPAACCGAPAELVERGRFAAAARILEEAAARGRPDRLLHARALFGLGRAEAALALLEGESAPVAALRAECLLALGRLGAAREALRRFEADSPSRAERFAASGCALRVLSLCGELEAAECWVAGLAARARGGERFEAARRAAELAYDRGDRAALERHVARAGELLAEPGSDPRHLELVALAAFDREDGPALERSTARRIALGRRRMGRYEAGRAWNLLGLGRQLSGDLRTAERAFAHAARLLGRCDGPLGVTLAGSNLAEVRLRQGRLDGVEGILAAATVENLRSGNRRAQLQDEALWARLELVRGELDAAVSRAERTAAAARAIGYERALTEAAPIAVRALGWLGREEEARRWLARSPTAPAALEPEERPFALALAGSPAEALEAAEASPFGALACELVRGAAPPARRWATLDPLPPFRRARFVLDAERVAPGSVPRALRAEAAATFRRIGASPLAELVTREEGRAWRALAAYCARPAGDPGPLAELLAGVGHPEATVLVRGAAGERVLVEGAAAPGSDELLVALGEGELVLRADSLDDPLRAVAALLERDLPPPRRSHPPGSPFVGESPALAGAIERLTRFADSQLPVLVLGENGTGKELAAELVHRSSPRAARPWVPVNCAGLPETLIQSHLFGHVRGAFTGADRLHVGYFERAQGSTLFLDEVGDLPLAVQGNLLRALQEGEIVRLGESLPRKIDVRVVAATNRDLERLVEEGRFREDLYYRLKVATVVLPPLRERGDDVLLLAEHFLEPMRAKRPGLALSSEARRALRAHPWPGNVRELKHVLEAAALLADGRRIEPEHLDLASGPPPEPERGRYHATLEGERRRLVIEALEATAGNKAAAARRLGMTRQNFSYLCKKLGIG